MKPLPNMNTTNWANQVPLSLSQTDKRLVIPILHTRDGRLLSTAQSYQPYAFWTADKVLYHRSKSLYSTLTLWSVLEQTDGGDGGGLESQRLSDMCILMWNKTGERSHNVNNLCKQITKVYVCIMEFWGFTQEYCIWGGGGGDSWARASSDIRERSDLSLQEVYICLSCNAYAVTAYAWNSRPRGNSRKGNNPNQPVNQTT